MKIQCDVCKTEAASLFCSADEAALCDACDRRVHHANKLAGKHQRFSLLHPSCKDAPRCDVCQERRAFLFCQEDRAIFCRECDLPIHTANEHTRKHNRFLLSGVKLSSSSPLYSLTTASSSNEVCDAVARSEMDDSAPPKKNKPTSVSSQMVDPPPLMVGTTKAERNPASEGGSTSSMSEYLIEMLPGWQVDDLFDSSFAASLGFCKNDDLSPFLNVDFESNLTFPSEDLAIWVPQVRQAPPTQHRHNHVESKEGSNSKATKRWIDDGPMVPQINLPSSKRSRPLW